MWLVLRNVSGMESHVFHLPSFFFPRMKSTQRNPNKDLIRLGNHPATVSTTWTPISAFLE